MRANDKTKFLFRSLLYLGDMVLSMTSHQQALAALLDEHSSLTGLRVKTLGGADFPGGEYCFLELPCPQSSLNLTRQH